jgi:peptidoglycan/LPS O-acetylase OafA/YrhL
VHTRSYAGLLSVTFGVGALIANVLVMILRRVKHRGGWRIVTILAALHGAWMLVAVALVAYEFNHDDRFYFGSRYGSSFIMACVSSGLNWLVALQVLVLGVTVGSTPPERAPLLGGVRRTIH